MRLRCICNSREYAVRVTGSTLPFNDGHGRHGGASNVGVSDLGNAQYAQNNAKAPKIHGVVVRLLLYQLRGHVKRRAFDRREHHRRGAHRPRETKVAKLHHSETNKRKCQSGMGKQSEGFGKCNTYRRLLIKMFCGFMSRWIIRLLIR